ncbi:hypothetical protein [Microvirga terrestris]|uniref:Uncharacterized protein n=1 Tax=Microvirga terrestris TaxID=2791024 RepID=A0ABS0HPX8_9HYPH|nr:hypothetical protein [Microvirga terrestris]MBF9195544.1 hypothetical protein [Microvirga terrestris]
MTKLKCLSAVLAGCLLAGSLATGVSAQSRMDRDWDNGRDWQDRDRGWERDRDWRDRDWDRGRRWRSERDCYYETRRERNRFGELIVRRYRVCED